MLTISGPVPLLLFILTFAGGQLLDTPTAQHRPGAADSRQPQRIRPDGIATSSPDSPLDGIVQQDKAGKETSAAGADTAPRDYLDIDPVDLETEEIAASSAGQTRRLLRRAANKRRMDATVEVFALVDYKIYSLFLRRTRFNSRKAVSKINRYYAKIMAMINERFKTINDPSISVKIVLSHVHIAKTKSDAAWVEYHVKRNSEGNLVASAENVLKGVQKWLAAKKNLAKHDHVMAFSRYNLVSRGGGNLEGLAYVSSMCKVRSHYSSSLVYDRGNMQCAGVGAHELGHSLGAVHDGIGKNTACPVKDNYVMVPRGQYSEVTSLNFMHFSRCSINKIKEYLRLTQAHCLYDEPHVFISHNLRKRPPGQRFSLDQQCKMTYGKKSGVCSYAKLLKGACSRLWCKDPEGINSCKTVYGLRALPGTTCASNKICWQGRCQNDFTRWDNHLQKETAKAITSASCGGPDKNAFYCRGIIRINPYACRRKPILDYCCQSCTTRRLYR